MQSHVSDIGYSIPAMILMLAEGRYHGALAQSRLLNSTSGQEMRVLTDSSNSHFLANGPSQLGDGFEHWCLLQYNSPGLQNKDIPNIKH